MDAIGGYRLVRKLGEGARAEVHLAVAGGEDASVVVKHYRTDVDAVSVSTEIEALARGVGEHTVALLDVATSPSGRLALILGRLPGASAGRVLAQRASLSLGETVGLLAPLADTVEALHRAGVVHGGIRADTVLFDDGGLPVLACFGRARLIQPGLPPALLELETGAEQDRLAFAAFARAVLERTDDREAVHALLDAVAQPGGAGWCAELGGWLREIAPASPVDLRAQSPVAMASAIPARVELPAAPRGERAALRRQAADQPARAIPDALAGILDGPRLAALAASLKAVRMRVWLLAGGVAVALVAAFVLVPAAGERPEAAPVPSASASTPAPEVSTDEDPEDALVRLLEVREGCIRDRSVLCLDAVAQQGSAALADDQELVLALQSGAESPASLTASRAQVTVVEQLGDAVLLSLDGVGESQPASVLIARDATGWLIRDYLER